MSWIIIVLIIVGIIWLVKRNRNRSQQPDQTQMPRQNMPQDRPNSGPNNPQQQRPVAAGGGKQCPYCARTVDVQSPICPSCGAKLPVPAQPQQGNTVLDNAQRQRQRGERVSGNSQIHEGQSGGSVLGDAVKTGAAVIATQAILGGLMGQGQAQAGNQMPPDPSMMPDSDYPDEADGPFPGLPGMGAGGNNPFGGILGNDDDSSSPFGNFPGNGEDSPFGNVLGNGSDGDNPMSGVFGGGLGSLDNLGGADDSNNAAGWVTDENDTGSNNGGWLASNDDDSSPLGNWPLGGSNDNDAGSSWSFSDDDDSSSSSSWSFGSDDSDSGSSWSFDDDD